MKNYEHDMLEHSDTVLKAIEDVKKELRSLNDLLAQRECFERLMNLYAMLDVARLRQAIEIKKKAA